jgi:hypothetical protein
MIDDFINIDSGHTWSAGGKYVGHRAGDYLWTDGRTTGRFTGELLYDTKCLYIGEMVGGRLLSDPRKRNRRAAGFIQRRALALRRMPGTNPKPIIDGYRDFVFFG